MILKSFNTTFHYLLMFPKYLLNRVNILMKRRGISLKLTRLSNFDLKILFFYSIEFALGSNLP